MCWSPSASSKRDLDQRTYFHAIWIKIQAFFIQESASPNIYHGSEAQYMDLSKHDHWNTKPLCSIAAKAPILFQCNVTVTPTLSLSRLTKRRLVNRNCTWLCSTFSVILTSVAPFTNIDLFKSHNGQVIISIIDCGMRLLTNSQSSTVQITPHPCQTTIERL